MSRVGIICGSDSDLEKASDACKILDELGVAYDLRIASAHRTPELLEEYRSKAEERGDGDMRAATGWAAHLPVGVPS